MGLDIFFYKRIPSAPKGKSRVTYYDLSGKRRWYPSQYKDGECEIGYFRKVNFLLPAFHYPDEDCADHRLTSEDFKAFIALCSAVLKDHSLAESLLPAQAGFFFGSDEYNDSYFHKVRRTRAWARNVLNNWDDTLEYYMHCWW